MSITSRLVNYVLPIMSKYNYTLFAAAASRVEGRPSLMTLHRLPSSSRQLADWRNDQRYWWNDAGELSPSNGVDPTSSYMSDPRYPHLTAYAEGQSHGSWFIVNKEGRIVIKGQLPREH